MQASCQSDMASCIGGEKSWRVWWLGWVEGIKEIVFWIVLSCCHHGERWSSSIVGMGVGRDRVGYFVG